MGRMSYRYVAAIEPGNSSRRRIPFDREGGVAGTGRREHAQVHPHAGWVEHDPLEIVANVRAGMAGGLAAGGASAGGAGGGGRATGERVANAIVGQDVRTAELVAELADGDLDRLRPVTGLPLSTYFSG